MLDGSGPFLVKENSLMLASRLEGGRLRDMKRLETIPYRRPSPCPSLFTHSPVSRVQDNAINIGARARGALRGEKNGALKLAKGNEQTLMRRNTDDIAI